MELSSAQSPARDLKSEPVTRARPQAAVKRLRKTFRSGVRETPFGVGQRCDAEAQADFDEELADRSEASDRLLP